MADPLTEARGRLSKLESQRDAHFRKMTPNYPKMTAQDCRYFEDEMKKLGRKISAAKSAITRVDQVTAVQRPHVPAAVQSFSRTAASGPFFWPEILNARASHAGHVAVCQ